MIKKTLESPSTYQNGCLTIGLYGSQPNSDPFWADAPEKWSAQKIGSGEDFSHDHRVDLR